MLKLVKGVLDEELKDKSDIEYNMSINALEEFSNKFLEDLNNF